jgi:hypothetical protein
MNILEQIKSNNGAAVQQLASQFGLAPAQAEAAMSALLPMVTAGLQREAATKGEAGLAAAIATGQHESYIDQPAVLADPATTLDGNAILGHMFGTKDVSRQVAAGAAQKSGIDPATLQKMLPVVAAIVMGYLAKRSKNAGAGAGPATGGAGTAPAANGGLGAILGSLLDRNRDGSVADDLAGMMGGALGRRG